MFQRGAIPALFKWSKCLGKKTNATSQRSHRYHTRISTQNSLNRPCPKRQRKSAIFIGSRNFGDILTISRDPSKILSTFVEHIPNLFSPHSSFHRGTVCLQSMAVNLNESMNDTKARHFDLFIPPKIVSLSNEKCGWHVYYMYNPQQPVPKKILSLPF